MAKAPAFPFYPGDWLRADDLAACEPATRGIWMDLLCRMWFAKRRGRLEGKTAKHLAQMCRCSESEMTRALGDMREHHLADIYERKGPQGTKKADTREKPANNLGPMYPDLESATTDPACPERGGDLGPIYGQDTKYTIVNRRMNREEQARKVDSERKRRARNPGNVRPDVQKRPADVQAVSSPSSSSLSSSCKNPPTPLSKTPEVKPPSAALAADLYWNRLRGKRALATDLIVLFQDLGREGWALSKLYQFAKSGPTSCGGSVNMTKIGMEKWAKEHGSKPTQTEMQADADDLWYSAVREMREAGLNRADWQDQTGKVKYGKDGRVSVGPFGTAKAWITLWPGGPQKLRDFTWWKEEK